MSEQRVTIHTDGACSGNPGPGGPDTGGGLVRIAAATADVEGTIRADGAGSWNWDGWGGAGSGGGVRLDVGDDHRADIVTFVRERTDVGEEDGPPFGPSDGPVFENPGLGVGVDQGADDRLGVFGRPDGDRLRGLGESDIAGRRRKTRDRHQEHHAATGHEGLVDAHR